MEYDPTRKNVLFLCVHNSARSQMAEGFLKKYAGDRFNVSSAGLEPTEVNPLAVEAMREVGIDISGQTSKSIDRFLGKETIHFAIFVCSQAEEACPYVYSLSLNRMSWPFEDPAGFEGGREEKLEKFREVRNRIDKRITNWLAGIIE